MENQTSEEQQSEPQFAPPAVLDFEEIGSEAAVTALYAAMAQARAEFLPIAKNRTSGKGSSKEFRYADLDASLDATVPSLSKHGLALIQPLSMLDGRALIRTTLAHKDGGRIRVVFTVPLPEGDDVQEFGKNCTYSRRYQYNAILCLAADPDKDDDGIPDRGGRQEPRRTPDAPREAPKSQPATPSARQASQPSAPRQEQRETAPLGSQPTHAPTSSGGSERPPAQTTAPTGSESQPASSGQELTDSEKKIASRLCQQGGCTNALQIRALIDKINGATDTKLGRANYRKTIVGLLSHLWTEKSGVSAADIDVFIGERAIDEVSVQETLAALAQQAQKAGA